MKIKPFKNRILLKYIKQEKKTPGGILIPDTAEDKDSPLGMSNRGKIIARGKDVDAKEFKIGTIVFFRRTDTIKVKLTGADTKDGREEKYMLIKDDEILGIIEDDS